MSIFSRLLTQNRAKLEKSEPTPVFLDKLEKAVGVSGFSRQCIQFRNTRQHVHRLRHIAAGGGKNDTTNRMERQHDRR